MTADAFISVGVVVERRELDNPWRDYDWRAVGVVAHSGAPARWRQLDRGDGWVRYLAATLDLELHRGETEGYRTNLSQDPPQVFIVLRPGEEADEMDMEPFHVTVCPFEAMGYLESGDELVEGVPMPAQLADWVGDFVAHHHVEEPFKKRRNKRHRDRQETRPRGRYSRGQP